MAATSAGGKLCQRRRSPLVSLAGMPLTRLVRGAGAAANALMDLRKHLARAGKLRASYELTGVGQATTEATSRGSDVTERNVGSGKKKSLVPGSPPDSPFLPDSRLERLPVRSLSRSTDSARRRCSRCSVSPREKTRM